MFTNNLFLKIKNKKSIIQLIHYGIIGIISNVLGYSAYLLLTYLGGTPKLTMSLLYVAVATVSFLSNRKLTFSYNGSFFGSGIRYTIAHFLGYLINLVMLIVMVDIFGYPHQWIQATAIFVVAIFLFLALKFFVFRER